MSVVVSLPLDRLGIIPEIAFRFNEKGLRLGKTALQKIVYMLQEISGINIGYDFSLYTYGPFDSQLLQDLDFVETLKGVNIEPVSEGYGGVNITPAEATDDLRRQSHILINDAVGRTLDRLLIDFGGFSAKEMELHSTLIFIDRDGRRRGIPFSSEKIISLVHEIKPHFDEETINLAFRDLINKRYIEPTSSPN